MVGGGNIISNEVRLLSNMKSTTNLHSRQNQPSMEQIISNQMIPSQYTATIGNSSKAIPTISW